MRAKIDPHRVFVYGTLRREERYHFLMKEARWLGQHKTHRGFTLLNFGTYPAAISGGCTGIIGEVYAVDKVILKRLDRLEGYPWEFTRNHIPTPYGCAWMYLYRRSCRSVPIIVSGDWCRRYY